MQIGYLGNFRHAHCTEVHMAQSIRDLGHTVVPLQEDDYSSFDYLRSMGGGLDALLYTRTWGLPAGSTTKLWRWLEQRGVTTASFHLDLFWGIERQKLLQRIRTDPLFTVQHVFTADGGHDVEFEEAGVNHHWLRPGTYAPECRRGRWRSQYACDVAFVGTDGRDYHPEWPWRQTMLGWLQRRFDYQRFGPGTKAGTVRGAQLRDVYASAKVVVGDSLMLGPKYWSDRVYETVGRGGFLVHPYIPELAEEMEDGTHLVYFEPGNLHDLELVLRHWLDPARDSARREMTDRGIQHVRENCSYGVRGAELLRTLTEPGSSGKLGGPRVEGAASPLPLSTWGTNGEEKGA